MNEQLKLLVELQSIDSAIIKHDSLIKTIPKKLSERTEALTTARKKLDLLSQRHEDAVKKKRDKELELKESKERIAKLNERTASIKDNKSYTAHLKEIETAEKTSNKLQDDISRAQEKVDTLGAELKEADDILKTEEARVEEERKKLEAKVADAKKDLNEMFKGRAKYRAPLEKELYDEYMTLLKNKGGLAVVPVTNEVCGGCNMNIMPQLFVEIKKNEELHRCPQCGRILFAENPKLNSGPH